MAAGRSKAKKPGQQVSLSAMAGILGVSEPTVRGYVRDGMPVAEVGQSGRGYVIDTGDAIRWLIARAKNEGGGQVADFDADRARKMAADADMAEMERDALRGNLVEVDTAVAMVADRLQTMRSRLLNLPTKVSVKMAAAKTRDDARDALEAEVRNLLEELAGSVGSDGED